MGFRNFNLLMQLFRYLLFEVGVVLVRLGMAQYWFQRDSIALIDDIRRCNYSSGFLIISKDN